MADPITSEPEKEDTHGHGALLAIGGAGLGLFLWHRLAASSPAATTTTTSAASPTPRWTSALVAHGSAPASPRNDSSGASTTTTTASAGPTASPVAPAPPSSSLAPSRSPTPPSSTAPTEPLSRAFDPVFAREGLGLPIAYLRALAAHDSNLTPTDPRGGLFRVLDIFRRDYNARTGADHPNTDLRNPDLNTRIAADTLAMIADSYRTRHHAPNMHEDWSNPRFCELLTLGWHSGWSETAGVGRVAASLEAMGAVVTLDAIKTAAALVSATSPLADDANIAFARAVVATYQRERNRDAHDGYVMSSLGTPMFITSAPGQPTTAVVATPAAPSSAPAVVPVAPVAPASSPAVTPPQIDGPAPIGPAEPNGPHGDHGPVVVPTAPIVLHNILHTVAPPPDLHAPSCPAWCAHPDHADQPATTPT